LLPSIIVLNFSMLIFDKKTIECILHKEGN
jgi:hypothetical protein